MSEELILRTENVCKSFNGIQVLKNVNLEIRKGEIHALMGENGAGKSTIIKIITGVKVTTCDSSHIALRNFLIKEIINCIGENFLKIVF